MRLQSFTITNIRSSNPLFEVPQRDRTLQRDRVWQVYNSNGFRVALFGLGSIKAALSAYQGGSPRRGVLKFNSNTYGIAVITKKSGATAQSSKNSYLFADGVREPFTPADLKPRVLNILKFREPPNVRATASIQIRDLHSTREIKSIPTEESARTPYAEPLDEDKYAAETQKMSSRSKRQDDPYSDPRSD